MRTSPQFEMVQGYVFVSNTMSNNTGPGTDMGVSRIVWQDETSSDSLNGVAQGLDSVIDGNCGSGKSINHFEVYGTGSFVYAAFNNMNDWNLGGAGGMVSPGRSGTGPRSSSHRGHPVPDGPLLLRLHPEGRRQPYRHPAGPLHGRHLRFYGGASIAFPPVTDVSGTTDAQIAGWNYVGSSARRLPTTHYTAGMDHWNDGSGGEQTRRRPPPATCSTPATTPSSSTGTTKASPSWIPATTASAWVPGNCPAAPIGSATCR